MTEQPVVAVPLRAALEPAWTCEWCGVPLTPIGGVWTDESPARSGDYCPEGRAVGDDGTSPHLPAPAEPEVVTAAENQATLRAALAVEAVRPEHVCANHDETLDEAYRRGLADGQWNPGLDEALNSGDGVYRP